MKCKICNHPTETIFNALVLKKHTVNYYKCSHCGFLQTEQPFWLEESYKSPINISDTGIIVRNQRLARISTSLIILLFNQKEKFVDYAGGYGLFTRMMRDIGFDFYWSDPYTQNLLAKNFEIEQGKKYHLATSFESFEHFKDPIAEVIKILEVCDNIILSTELVPEPTPAVSDWWYYGAEHGQHIALYSKKSFIELANRLNLHYYNMGNVHLLTKKKIPVHARILLQLPFVKYILYVTSFLFTPFLKSKTMDDLVSAR